MRLFDTALIITLIFYFAIISPPLFSLFAIIDDIFEMPPPIFFFHFAIDISR